NGLETGAAARCDAGAVLPSTLAPLPDCLVGLRLVPRRGAPLQLGAAHLRFGVLDVPLGGFWQSNGRGNELLVEELRKAALELAPLGGHVLELYCGAGNLTRVLAESSTHLVAVEASADAIAALNRRADMATVASAGSAPSAVSDAGHAASGLSATTLAGSAAAGKTSGPSVGAASSSIWGTSQIELHAQPVERFLAACRADFDWVVLDPPRSGAAVAIPELVRLRPRGVIYISCDLHTAARDIEQLLGAGYELTRVQPIDMFPQTYHVETIFVLRDAH
ncbi:MAG: hypothetical protein KC609_04210, partial [Myxococcales bacterium]|nr:hypothetical protein [Myxococcales bacterium]